MIRNDPLTSLPFDRAYQSITTLAQELGIPADLIRQWVYAGKVTVMRPRGGLLVLSSDVRRMLAKEGAAK